MTKDQKDQDAEKALLEWDARQYGLDECVIGQATVVIDHGRAWLIRVHVPHPEVPDEIWIPKSVVHAHCQLKREGDQGRLTVCRWWVRKQTWRTAIWQQQKRS